MGAAAAVLISSATLAQAGHHDIQCPGSQTLKLCRDGGNCNASYPDYSTDTNDVLHFLGVRPGDQVSLSVTNDSKAAATVDLKGQGNTSFSQILTNIAAGATVASNVYTVASGDEPRASIKIDVDHSGNPDPTAITYTASCSASSPPPGQGIIRIIKNTNGGDGTFSFTSSDTTNAPIPGPIVTTNGSGSFEIVVKNFPDGGNTPRLDVNITETVPSGWTLDDVSCVDIGGSNPSQGQRNQNRAKVSVEPGELVACTFTNTSTTTGSITITKEADAAGTFPFTTTGKGTEDFELAITSAGGGSASKTFSSLEATSAGTSYSFTENTPTGFKEPKITCYGGTGVSISGATTTIPLKPGQNVQCTYNNEADATGLPDLTINKKHTGNATQGQTGFQYRLKVTNSGGAPTSGTVTVTDWPPTGLTVTGMSGDGWACPTTSTCTRSDALAPGSSYPDIIVTVDVASDAEASVTNEATVEGGGETNTTNNRARDDTIVQASARDLTLTKSASPGLFGNVGEIITYTYVVQNGSGTPIDNVKITDDKVPAFNCGAITLPTTLSAGASLTCTGVYTITETDMTEGSVTNHAQAFGDPEVQSNVASATVKRNDKFIRERTQQVIGNFLQRRTDLLLSEEPDRNRYVRRFTGSLWGEQSSQVASSGSGSKVSLTGDGSAARFAFSTGLRQMAADARAAAEAERTGKEVDGMMALGAGPAPASGAEQLLRSGWDLWVEGHYAHFDDDRMSGGNSGHLGVMYVGADYLLTPAILIGALIQFDTMEDESAAAGTAVKGNGWLVGPYMSAKLSDNLFFDARVAWGQSDNSVDPLGFYTDNFDTDRWLAKGNLTGNWNWDAWRFTPSVGISYVEESQKAYGNALGIYIPGQSVSLGRVTFGPEIGYRFQAADGTYIEPHASITGIWDFDKSDALVLGDEVVGTDEFRGKLQAGILFTMPSGYTVRARGSYDGIGSDDFEAYGGQLWVNLPLN